MDGSDAKQGGQVVLKRKITLLSGVTIIVGSIIGSGIFVSPGGVIHYAGSGGAALIIWALCGLFCILGALCFSELGCMMPEAGGEYKYIMEAFGGLPAFLTLWVNVLMIRPAAQAIIALTFAEYALSPFFPGCEPPKVPVMALATAALGTLTYINCVSVRMALRIQNFFTAAKLLALIVVIATGLVILASGDVENLSNIWEGEHTPGGIAVAFYSGLFAFGGWNYLNCVTEELKDPYKNLPRAICIALPLVTLVYFFTNVAYLTVLTAQEVVSSNAVAMDFARQVLGPVQYCVPVFVAMSTFGGLNGSLFTSGRLFLAGACQGHLPPVLSFIHVTKGTPVPALISTCVVSMLLLPFDIFSLINCLSFVLWLTIGAAVAGLLWLRRAQPERPRPVKCHTAIPIIFLIGCLYLVIVPMISEPRATGMGILITLSGIPVYAFGVLWKNKPKWIHNAHDGMTLFLQKTWLVVSQDAPNADVLLQDMGN